MEVYSKEEIMNYMETCKKNGIQDVGRLFQIQAAMRAGLNNSLLAELSRLELSERQIQQIIGLAVNSFPEEELVSVCREPERLEQHREAYYQGRYGNDPKKVYQEVFDTFQVQWQRNFDQVLKQTEILSNTLEFLKEQVKQKEQEIMTVTKQAEELHMQVEKERKRAEELELEKLSWEVQRSGAESRENVKDAAQSEENVKVSGRKEDKPADLNRRPKGPSGMLAKVSAFCQRKEKHPEQKLITFIGNLEEEQIEQVLDGYEQGLTLEEIQSYAKPGYNAYQMEKMKNLLLKGR